MQFEASLSSLFFPIPILFDLKLGVPVRARVPRTNCFGERVERSIVCCKQTVRGSGVPIDWFVFFSAKHGAKSELALLLELISLALQNVRRINLRPGWMLQNLLMNLPCRENQRDSSLLFEAELWRWCIVKFMKGSCHNHHQHHLRRDMRTEDGDLLSKPAHFVCRCCST